MDDNGDERRDGGTRGAAASGAGGRGQPRFALEVIRRGTRCELLLSEELDPHSAPRVRAAIDDVGRDTTELVLDLSGVTFIDSSGLREILYAQERLTDIGGRLVLRSPSTTARRLLEITGLVDRIEIVEGRDPST